MPELFFLKHLLQEEVADQKKKGRNIFSFILYRSDF